MKIRFFLSVLVLFLFVSSIPTWAASYKGMIVVTRDSSRSISGAVLETQNRDGSGQPVTYNIVMDDNGKAVAEQYENKDIKIEGTLKGRDLTVIEWIGIKEPSSGDSSYSEPEPQPQPASEDSGDEEAKDDEEPREDDDEPKDEEPKEAKEESEESED